MDTFLSSILPFRSRNFSTCWPFLNDKTAMMLALWGILNRSSRIKASADNRSSWMLCIEQSPCRDRVECYARYSYMFVVYGCMHRDIFLMRHQSSLYRYGRCWNQNRTTEHPQAHFVVTINWSHKVMRCPRSEYEGPKQKPWRVFWLEESPV